MALMNAWLMTALRVNASLLFPRSVRQVMDAMVGCIALMAIFQSARSRDIIVTSTATEPMTHAAMTHALTRASARRIGIVIPGALAQMENRRDHAKTQMIAAQMKKSLSQPGNALQALVVLAPAGALLSAALALTPCLLLVLRIGIVMIGLIASQMALSGEFVMMQTSVELSWKSHRSLTRALMKAIAMTE
jgi:hypothetical protein